MTELKPCPFCGGAVTIADYGDYLSIITKGTDPKVSCRCRLFMESEKFAEGDREARRRAEDSLSEKWNRRFDGWHTGTPTEEGWYLIAFNYEFEGGVRYTTDYFKDGKWAFPMVRDISKLRAWQRIEPYKEESNG